ncbi:MAG: bacillithiol biosynthesis deacetylase BshB1 [Bacteroidetes bacterium]|nr:bacillithiol biosynthesis deacetylase BshB1 [Bacteroidota bacterium]
MKLDILAFGVHPDDVEISAAGTIIKHLKMGMTAGVIDLTQGELGTRGTAATRMQESESASQIMGSTVRHNLAMEDGFFENNQNNKLKIIEMVRLYQPTIILCNALNDRHPDHGRSGRLVSDACFLSGLSKISTEYNGHQQQAWRPRAVYHYTQDRYHVPTFVVDISEHIDAKMESIKAYKSQFHDPKSNEPATYISSPEFLDSIKARSAEYGRQIGVKYAEAFITERYPGINDLRDLI